jgi:hypothetical protein
VKRETPSTKKVYFRGMQGKFAPRSARVNKVIAASIRFPIIRLILLPLLVAGGRGQAPAKPEVGARFDSVASTFERQVNTLPKIRGENGYSSASVNAALQKTKDATLSPIPPQDKPLRGYVERAFPAPVDEATEVVPKEEAEQRFSLVRELLAKLSRLDSFRLDLTVNTNPPKARFELIPRVGTSIASATNARLTNIYRGEYDYTITKAGYKRIHETINFIDRSGSILECDLQPEASAEEALPCKFR